MTKEELTLEVIARLKKEYPLAVCTLDYNDAWKLLVSVRLAAQCTDARVNVVVKDLYAKYPDVDALANAPVEEIEAIVKPCGLGRSKARDISACMKMLRDQFDSRVPDDFDALLSLPGVGRKSANLIMGDVFGKPAMVTDTHCIRLVLWKGLRSRKKWRWFCGSWFRRRREAISAIVSFTMDGMYALPEQSPIVSAAACLTSVRKQEYKISVL